MADQRKFKVLYVFSDPRTGRTTAIHEGEALPAQWDDYLSETGPAAREILRLADRDKLFILLKDVRKALDSGQLFVTRAEGRDAAVALLDRLNDAIGDPRSETARKEVLRGDS